MTLGNLGALLLAPALVFGGGGALRTPAAAPLPAPRAVEAPVTWQIDGAHSEVAFRIRHLVSRVRGRFTQFGGTVVADPQNLSAGSVDVTIQTASITTDVARRDEHLRSGDFFDAPNHPTITFKSTRVQQTGDNLKVYGNLTIRGVTKPVVLDGRFTGMGGPTGHRRIGFEATTTVNRMDYGVSWNRAAEGGGALLGDEVEITLTVEAAEKV
jgi:polyisoprenoid-binding protein YceI